MAPAAPITWPLLPPHPHWPPSSDSLFTLSAQPRHLSRCSAHTHSSFLPLGLCVGPSLLWEHGSLRLCGVDFLFFFRSQLRCPHLSAAIVPPQLKPNSSIPTFTQYYTPSILCMACTPHRSSSSSLVCLSLPLWCKHTRAEIHLSCSPLCPQLPTWCLHTVGAQ